MSDFIKATYPHGWKTVILIIILIFTGYTVMYTTFSYSNYFKCAKDFILKNELIERNIGQVQHVRLAYFKHLEYISFDDDEWVRLPIYVAGEKNSGIIYMVVKGKYGAWRVVKAELKPDSRKQMVIIMENKCMEDGCCIQDC